MLTVERLRELLAYDFATGVFRWRVYRNCNARVGDRAGIPDRDGYLIITIDYRHHFAHRLAWLYAHGEWPPGDLDHKDNIPGNDRLENLRPATRTQNNGNRKRRFDSAGGFKGVSRVATKNVRWQARISVNHKSIHLGCFGSPEDAHAAYMAAAIKHFGEFARAQ